jgi:hypothetical protein
MLSFELETILIAESIMSYFIKVCLSQQKIIAAIIIILFHSYLFTCKLNSPEANYKVCKSKEEEKQQNTHTKLKKQDNLYNQNNNNNSIDEKIKLSLRSEKSKVYTFTKITISILMTGRTMASIKYDSKK